MKNKSFYSRVLNPNLLWQRFEQTLLLSEVFSKPRWEKSDKQDITPWHVRQTPERNNICTTSNSLIVSIIFTTRNLWWNYKFHIFIWARYNTCYNVIFQFIPLVGTGVQLISSEDVQIAKSNSRIPCLLLYDDRQSLNH